MDVDDDDSSLCQISGPWHPMLMFDSADLGSAVVYSKINLSSTDDHIFSLILCSLSSYGCNLIDSQEVDEGEKHRRWCFQVHASADAFFCLSEVEDLAAKKHCTRPPSFKVPCRAVSSFSVTVVTPRQRSRT